MAHMLVIMYHPSQSIKQHVQFTFIFKTFTSLKLKCRQYPAIHTNYSKLDLTTFFLYLSKITSNLPENYLSRSKTTSEKSYSSKK